METKTLPPPHAAGFIIWSGAVAFEALAVLLAAQLLTGQPLLPGAVLALPVPADWILAVALHMAAVVLFVLPAPFSRSFYPLRSTIYGLSAVLTLCLPGFGILGCMFARSCAKLLMRHKNRTAQFMQSIEMSLGEDTNWINRKRIGQVLADEIAIEPVVDVLQGDDPDMKRGAVKLLKRMGTPGAVGLLRSCMSDPFPEVRFYAHSALSELEDNFTKNLKAMRTAVDTAPSAGAWRILGREYRTYADSGLVDEVMRKQTLEESRAAFMQSLALEPGHAPTLLGLGRVLLELGELDEAAQQFEQCVQVEQTASEALLGLTQIAYERRDLRQLAAYADAMARSNAPRPSDADNMALFEFWAGQGHARHG